MVAKSTVYSELPNCLNGLKFTGDDKTDREAKKDFQAEAVAMQLDFMWTPGLGKERHDNLHAMGRDFIEFAKLAKVLTFEQFLVHKMIVPRSFNNWNNECPYFKTCTDMARGMIGERRERLALLGKINSRMVMYSQRMYNSKFVKMEEDRSQMKYVNMKEQGIECVKMPYFISTSSKECVNCTEGPKKI